MNNQVIKKFTTMKRILFGIIVIPFIAIILMNVRDTELQDRMPAEEQTREEVVRFQTIAGIVQPRDTMEAIFKKYDLSRTELAEISETAKDSYNLSMLSVGRVYFFEVDDQNMVQSMQYEIDDRSFLKISRSEQGFSARKVNVKYDKRIGSLYLQIEDNLMVSMPGRHREYLKLALELSDIYAWDIDFSTDIRNGDTVKVIVEELWVGKAFKGYGNILAAEFINNGKVYEAYRFEDNEYVDYYDRDGKSLRKALLKSPLKFKYVSSRFSRRRFHPILRIYRPHLGVDYAAPGGTPVSASGSGTVVYSGYKGQNGKMVRIKHAGGYETYYGHLSRIPRKIKKGVKIAQGDIIGYVGSTGLSTGPHLDYRIKRNGKFINPLKLQLPRSKSVPEALAAEFKKVTGSMVARLVLLKQPMVAHKEKVNKSG